MINYTEKGAGLHGEIKAQGHWLREQNGVWISSDDAAVQSIINTFDALSTAKLNAIDRINNHAGVLRESFVPSSLGQTETHRLKFDDAKSYKAAVNPTLSDFPFIQSESIAIGGTGTEAADLILAKASLLINAAAQIEGDRRSALVLIDNETDWTQCALIANNYIGGI